VDPKESLEEALRREIKEELRIAVGKFKYLGSCPNVYEYEGVLYNTCDIFFYSKINTLPTDFDRTEIEELILINPLEVPNDKIAFESVKIGLGLLNSLESRTNPGAHQMITDP
jgi:NADH pyrophosphatase NudC (nudix superfamily)